MAIAEAVVVEHGLEVSRFSVDRVGIVLDGLMMDGGGDRSIDVCWTAAVPASWTRCLESLGSDLAVRLLRSDPVE